MVVVVDAGVAGVEVRWWDPFDFMALIHAGIPAAGTVDAAVVGPAREAEFVDVVMHEKSLEFRLEEVAVVEGSPLVGKTLRDTHLRDETGALVLALRRRDGSFETNPSPDEVISKGEVIIAIGTQEELQSLIVFVAP